MKVLPTVFVVDDDPIIVESLQAVLSAQGYIVKSFQTAEEFLVLNRSNAVGCVLIDLILPGMNGNELWKKLVAAGSMLSVIVVTGWIESLDLSWQRARFRRRHREALRCLGAPFASRRGNDRQLEKKGRSRSVAIEVVLASRIANRMG